MASDLISRDALLAEYDRAHKGPPGGARKLIAEAPAIDAEPVRHGEWVHVEDDEYLCSACKMEFTIEDFDSVVTNYCPNCGTKMDGGKQDAD